MALATEIWVDEVKPEERELIIIGDGRDGSDRAITNSSDEEPLRIGGEKYRDRGTFGYRGGADAFTGQPRRG